MDFPGWTTETTHSTDIADPDYCHWCADAVAPAIAFALDWGSDAFQASFDQPEGTAHVIVVRAV